LGRRKDREKTAIIPRKADLEAVSERLPEVVNQFRRDYADATGQLA
jgi:hypothetical protein